SESPVQSASVGWRRVDPVRSSQPAARTLAEQARWRRLALQTHDSSFSTSSEEGSVWELHSGTPYGRALKTWDIGSRLTLAPQLSITGRLPNCGKANSLACNNIVIPQAEKRRRMIRFEGKFGEIGIKTAWPKLKWHRRFDAKKECKSLLFRMRLYAVCCRRLVPNCRDPRAGLGQHSAGSPEGVCRSRSAVATGILANRHHQSSRQRSSRGGLL